MAKGRPWQRGWGFQGMRRYPFLIPIYFVATVGASGYFIMGLHALTGPDVCLRTRPRLESSNEAFRKKQYKIWGSGNDEIVCHAPIYWPQPGENIQNPYDNETK